MHESRLFAAAIEHLPDAVIIVDAETADPGPRIVFVNAAFTRLTGYAPLDVLGRDLCSLVGPHLDPSILGRLQAALATGNAFTAETVTDGCDGIVHTLAWSLTPVSERDDGCSSHGVVVVRDLTELRHTEHLLRHLQKTESLGLLSGAVAHDFNNLLTVIRASGELGLMDDAVPPELRTLLQQIVATSERAACLTRQLLHFSRHEPPCFQPVGLNAIITHLTTMLGRVLGEAVTLELQLAPELPLVFADTAMLEQVVVNLVVNARDALHHGGRIVVQTEDVLLAPTAAFLQRDGRHVRLVVRYNGRGIAPAQLSCIFDPFFTTKAAGKATGLGLSTVQAIVRQHHGWVDVDSALDRGSTFSVYLPARPDLETQPLHSAAPAASATGPRGGHETILIVEDDMIVRSVTTQALRHFGYTVTAVRTGPEALRMVNTGVARPDLLLTDDVLPEGRNGRELTEALRERCPQLRAIIMSGRTPPEDELAWLRASRTAFLAKPFSVNTLALIVRDTLDGELPVDAPARAG